MEADGTVGGSAKRAVKRTADGTHARSDKQANSSLSPTRSFPLPAAIFLTRLLSFFLDAHSATKQQALSSLVLLPPLPGDS